MEQFIKGGAFLIESIQPQEVFTPEDFTEEQRLVSHLFHQVELELEAWLSLAATLIAQRVQNVAVISVPKPAACQFKHLELVSLQDFLLWLSWFFMGLKSGSS
jgi:heat-inducible transcriptional repressor